jgi:hypothetical protein
MSAELIADACRRTPASFATGGRAAGLASAILMLAWVSPAAAGGVVTNNCVFTGFWTGGVSCARIWRDSVGNPYVMRVPAPRSDEEVAEATERDRLWQARCRPVVHQDMYGVNRYRYAAAGCEYGKYE